MRLTKEMQHDLRGFAEECLRRIEATPNVAGEELHTRQTYVDILSACDALDALESEKAASVAAALEDAVDAASQAAQIIVTSLGNMESGDATGVELDLAMKAALGLRPRLIALIDQPSSAALDRGVAEKVNAVVRDLLATHRYREHSHTSKLIGGYCTCGMFGQTLGQSHDSWATHVLNSIAANRAAAAKDQNR